MTREEAKLHGFSKEDRELEYSGNYNHIDNVIDKIYDDFESRTCENCDHWFQAITRDKDNNNTTTPTCMLFAMSDDEYTIFPDKDFGCNKWEAKDESN